MLLAGTLALAGTAVGQTGGNALRPSLTETVPPPPDTGAPRNDVGRGGLGRDESRLPTLTPIPPSAGATGFDSTGRNRRRAPPPRPGARNLGGRVTALSARIPSAAQQAAIRQRAPQRDVRATYSEIYTPADSPRLTRRPRPSLDDAYEPLGIRAGSWLLKPGVEASRGYDTNATRLTGGRPSAFTLLSGDLVAATDWSTHAAGAVLRGSYSQYDDNDFLNRPAGEGRVFGRIDGDRDLFFDVEARGAIGTDNPGSPNVAAIAGGAPAGLAQLPIFTTFGGGGGVTQRINRLELSAKGGFDRLMFEDSKLTDGTTFSNADRAYNQYSGSARVAYEQSPGFKPFVEVAADQRDHDLKVDRFGFRRDSQALTPRVGTTFELTRWITGEVSVGYVMRDYKDPALANISGVVADGALTWIASGLTTVKATASSRVEESILPGVSGALKRDVGLEVNHSFRRWLIGTGFVRYGDDDYVGLGRQDQRLSLGAIVTYKLNRDFAVKGEVRQDWLWSNVPGFTYDATVVLAGVRLTR